MIGTDREIDTRKEVERERNRENCKKVMEREMERKREVERNRNGETNRERSKKEI